MRISFHRVVLYTNCRTDLCQLPHETGDVAHELKYFYDSATGECKQFIYGGCRGNENKFEDICQERCVNQQELNEVNEPFYC